MSIQKVNCTKYNIIQWYNSPRRVYTNSSDCISFKAKTPMLLSPEEGEKASEKLKKSTAGYRADIHKEFNDKFVFTMTHAVIKYMKDRNQKATLVGGDTREATKKYAPQIIKMFLDNGIDVIVPKLKDDKKNIVSPVASPVLALLTKQNEIPLSVLLTASHNPWNDGGYNFLTNEGCVADSSIIEKIADNIKLLSEQKQTKKHTGKKGKMIEVDPYEIYKKYFDDKKFADYESIRKANIDIYYEDFKGTGGYYLPKLMKENGIEVKNILSSKTVGPNPDKENLQNLSSAVQTSDKKIKIGFATDGDSDRFGIIDENGEYISASDAMLLCAYHLIKNKGMKKGTIIRNNSTSSAVDELAEYFNKKDCKIKVEQTPVGFKYLGGKMVALEKSEFPVIVAGESSGGLTLRNHLPEKDGFVAIFTILDLVAKENKPAGQLLREIKQKVNINGVSKNFNILFSTDKEKDFAIKKINKFIENPSNNSSICDIPIDFQKTIEEDKKIRQYKPDGDGIKIYLKDKSSLTVRKSGTEPVLRIFIDASSKKMCSKIEKFMSEHLKN